MHVAMAAHVSGDLGSPEDLHRAGRQVSLLCLWRQSWGPGTEKGCQSSGQPAPHPTRQGRGGKVLRGLKGSSEQGRFAAHL